MSDGPVDARGAAGDRGVEDAIAVESTLAASPALVWAALTDAGIRANWWPGLSFDAVPGSPLRERWTEDDAEQVAHGTVREVVRHELLCFSWSDVSWEAATTVTITLAAGGRDTLVRVVERGLSQLSTAADVAREHRAGWSRHLDGLRRFVEPIAAEGRTAAPSGRRRPRRSA